MTQMGSSGAGHASPSPARGIRLELSRRASEEFAFGRIRTCEVARRIHQAGKQASRLAAQGILPRSSRDVLSQLEWMPEARKSLKRASSQEPPAGKPAPLHSLCQGPRTKHRSIQTAGDCDSLKATHQQRRAVPLEGSVCWRD